MPKARTTRPSVPRERRPAAAAWRTVLVAVAVAAAAAAFWWFRPATASRGAVVLISIDTLRADRLPVYGYAKGRTPALDAFAQDAVVFENAFAHAPQTLPSHASMFTGRLPFEHKVRDNLGFVLPDGSATLATLCRQAGYRTGGFVSAYVMRPETGIAQGFETYDAVFPPAAIDRSPGQVQRDGATTLAAATKWLAAQPDNRFLLFFHIYEPHRPYAPPASHAAGDPYDGEVSYSDEIVGRLLAELKRRGWYDSAAILVLSDHGEGLGDHGEQEHGLFLYHEVTRVPWLLKLPTNEAGGRRIAHLVQHIDVLPTLLDVAGVAVPDQLQGETALRSVRGPDSSSAAGVYAEALYPRYHFGWSELMSLTDERYRYIKAPREELYDLSRDPTERTNVAAERPQVTAAMRSALQALVAGQSIDAPSAVTTEERERLAALGYIGTQSSPSTQTAGATLRDPKDMVHVLRKYREAVDAIGAQKFEEGAALLQDILEENPEMSDVWSQYGAVLARIGRNADAFRAYQQVIKRRLDPREASGPLGAASALIALGRLSEARTHAELAINGSPAAAHQTLANIAIAKQEYDAALRHAELAHRADPTLSLPALVRGTVAHRRGQYAEALVHLQQAREAYAKRTLQPAELHYLIGDSLAQLERYREAEPYLREEVRLYPGSLKGYAALALLYQSTGRPAAAEEALADMLKRAPSPAAYDTAAKIWRMFGNSAKAAAVEAEGRRRFAK